MLVLVAAYTMFKKIGDSNIKSVYLVQPKFSLYRSICGYRLFGPGTGSFFILLMIGDDFLQATGNAKAINFTSKLAALIMF